MRSGKDTLGEKGQALYDELAANVFPGACESYLASADGSPRGRRIMRLPSVIWAKSCGWTRDTMKDRRSMNWRVHTGIMVTVRMRQKYFQQVVDGYGDSEYAEDAQQSPG